MSASQNSATVNNTIWFERSTDLSFTMPAGSHNFYQGRGVGRGVSAISETVVPMNVKFCGVLETSLNALELLKLLT